MLITVAAGEANVGSDLVKKCVGSECQPSSRSIDMVTGLSVPTTDILSLMACTILVAVGHQSRRLLIIFAIWLPMCVSAQTTNPSQAPLSWTSWLTGRGRATQGTANVPGLGSLLGMPAANPNDANVSVRYSSMISDGTFAGLCGFEETVLCDFEPFNPNNGEGRSCGIEAVAPAIRQLRNPNCNNTRRQVSYWRRFTLDRRRIWFDLSFARVAVFSWRASSDPLQVTFDVLRPILYPAVLIRDLAFCLDDVLTIASGGEEGVACLQLGDSNDEVLTRFLGGTLYVYLSMLLSAGTSVMVACGVYEYFQTVRFICNVAAAVAHNGVIIYIALILYGINGEVLTGFTGGNMLLCHCVGVVLSLFYCLASYPQELHWSAWLTYPLQWSWRLTRLGVNRFFATTSVTKMVINTLILVMAVFLWYYIIIFYDSAALLSLFVTIPRQASGCHELVDCSSVFPSWMLRPIAVIVALLQPNFSHTFLSWRTKSAAFMTFVSYLWWGPYECAQCSATSNAPATSYQLDGFLAMVGFLVMAFAAYSALKRRLN